VGALIITLLYTALFVYLFYIQSNKMIKNIGFVVFTVFVFQILLGISNVIMSLPISIAVLHTVNASILLLSMITLLFYSTYHTQE
jgi:cytochrome c oxidase assembly protein subunit 15